MTLHNIKHLYNYTYCHEYLQTFNVKSFKHIPLNVIETFLSLYMFENKNRKLEIFIPPMIKLFETKKV